MKKYISLFIVFVLSICIVGCSNTSENEPSDIINDDVIEEENVEEEPKYEMESLSDAEINGGVKRSIMSVPRYSTTGIGCDSFEIHDQKIIDTFAAYVGTRYDEGESGYLDENGNVYYLDRVECCRTLEEAKAHTKRIISDEVLNHYNNQYNRVVEFDGNLYIMVLQDCGYGFDDVEILSKEGNTVKAKALEHDCEPIGNINLTVEYVDGDFKVMNISKE